MIRVASLAGALALLGVESASAIGPRIEAFRVEGYLDRAPADTRVIEEMKIGRGAQTRIVYVVASDELSTESCASCPSMYVPGQAYSIVGDAADVTKLLETPAGEKIFAVFSRPRSDRHMLVQDVMTGDDAKSVAESDEVRGSQG